MPISSAEVTVHCDDCAEEATLVFDRHLAGGLGRDRLLKALREIEWELVGGEVLLCPECAVPPEVEEDL